MIKLEIVREFARPWLLQNLPDGLYYHNLRHTIDVVESALHIAATEAITNPHDLCLLETAAWLHDTGFAYTYTGHEAESCRLAKSWLPNWGAAATEVEMVCELILATRIPQRPQTKLQEILCDADLDYLGRSDFETIANGLYKEWLAVGFVQSESDFQLKQLNFIKQQQYFTAFSQQNRQPALQLFLQKHLPA